MAGLPSSALLGSETPRVFTPPLRELTPETTLGFEVIRFAEEVLGITLMPWQKWLLIHVLELNEDGTFRFRTWLLLVARQSGKTTLVMVLALWRMFVDGAGLVIGTAQNLDVAEEAWNGAVEMAEGVPELADEIAHVDRTNGKKALRLESGERYKVAAASRRGGRGLSGDLVMLDELREHQTWDAWAAVTKTTMARPRPQIACMSNAGDERSVVLQHLRDRALAFIKTGKGDPSLGIFEWSAPEGCSIEDRAGWSQANPALGYTITEAAIASASATDPEEVFRTEVLCQWVKKAEADPVIPAEAWDACLDMESTPDGVPVFGIDVDPERAWSSVTAVARRADGLVHIEIVSNDQVLDHRPGTDWLLAELLRLSERWPGATYAGDELALGSLATGLRRLGIEPRMLTGKEYGVACAGFLDAVTAGAVRHIGQPELDVAVAALRKRQMGEGFVWTHRGTSSITPAVGATVALHVLEVDTGGEFGFFAGDLDDDDDEERD